MFVEGMRVVYDRKKHEFSEFSLNGEPIRDDKFYTVGLQRFHLTNTEENLAVSLDEVSANRKMKVVTTSRREVLDEYLSEHRHLDAEVEGRLVIV